MFKILGTILTFIVKIMNSERNVTTNLQEVIEKSFSCRSHNVPTEFCFINWNIKIILHNIKYYQLISSRNQAISSI